MLYCESIKYECMYKNLEFFYCIIFLFFIERLCCCIHIKLQILFIKEYFFEISTADRVAFGPSARLGQVDWTSPVPHHQLLRSRDLVRPPRPMQSSQWSMSFRLAPLLIHLRQVPTRFRSRRPCRATISFYRSFTASLALVVFDSNCLCPITGLAVTLGDTSLLETCFSWLRRELGRWCSSYATLANTVRPVTMRPFSLTTSYGADSNLGSDFWSVFA